METNLCLVILIGLPGSGKTTFCESLIRRLREEKDSGGTQIYNIFHVNYDNLIPTAKTDNFVSWKEKRRIILSLVEKILLLCKLSKSQKNHSEVGTNINDDHFAESLKHYSECVDKDSHQVWLIIDDNMYYRSMRYDYYQLARCHSIGFCQIYFECSLQEALKYNSNRKPDHAVPEEVIKRMSNKLEPPNLNNSWEEFSLVLKSHEPFSRGVETAVIELVGSALRQPVTPPTNTTHQQDISKAICLTNITHQVDIRLRKIISEKIKLKSQSDTCKGELQAYSKHVNGIKHRILKKLKAGDLQLPNYLEKNVTNSNGIVLEGLQVWVEELFHTEFDM